MPPTQIHLEASTWSGKQDLQCYKSDIVSPAAPSTDLEYLPATTRSCAPLHPSFLQCIQCGPCYRRLLPQPHSVGRMRSVARCKTRCLRHTKRLVSKCQQLHKHLAIALAMLRSSFCTHKLQSSKVDLKVDHSQTEAAVNTNTNKQPRTNAGMTTEMSGRRALDAEGRECFAPIQTLACCFSYIDAKVLKWTVGKRQRCRPVPGAVAQSDFGRSMMFRCSVAWSLMLR